MTQREPKSESQPASELQADRARLAAYRAGDHATFEGVYAQYLNLVVRVVRGGFGFESAGRPMRFFGMRAQADWEEAVQEIFLKLFRESTRLAYDGITPFSQYAAAVARNHCLDMGRKQQRYARCFAPTEVDESQGEAPGEAMEEQVSPEQWRLRKELQQIVADFAARLSSTDREVLVAHLMHGESQRGVAEALSMDRNEVRKIIATLRKRLFVELRKQGYGPESAQAVWCVLLVAMVRGRP